MTDSDPRYPYTYACDYIRAFGPVNSEGVVLSRADASQISEGVAQALGMDTEELACKLADAQLVRDADPVIQEQQTHRLMRALGYGGTV